MLDAPRGIQRPSIYEPSPRHLRDRKVALSDEEKRRRQRRTHVPRSRVWVDPNPEVQGTLIEKLVYAELERRNIPFEYQAKYSIEIPEIDLEEEYRPDFFIPDKNMILDPLSAYHHARPEVIERDAFKYALFDHKGIQVEMWWDYEVMENLDELFNRAGLDARESPGGRIRTDRDAERDDAAGIVSQNQSRKQYQRAYHRGRSSSRSADGVTVREVTF